MITKRLLHGARLSISLSMKYGTGNLGGQTDSRVVCS